MLINSEVTRQFHNLGDLKKSSFASLKNGGKQGIFIIFLYGTLSAPTARTSKNLKRLVKSTLSDETLALEVSLETCFLINLSWLN